MNSRLDDRFQEINYHFNKVDLKYDEEYGSKFIEIKKNFIKLVNILLDKNNYPVKSSEYSISNDNLNIGPPVYNSLQSANKVSSYYVFNMLTLNFTTFLTDGVCIDFEKNHDLQFKYYNYVSKTNTIVTKDDYMGILKGFNKINRECGTFLQKMFNGEFVHFEFVKMYNFNRANILEIAYYHFEPLAKKYKFEKDFFKRLNIEDIIDLCICDEKKLLERKSVNDSIEKCKKRKHKILYKIKKNFTGEGSIWKFICSSDVLYKEELQYIAEINGVKNPEIMTKQDICQELERLALKNKTEILGTCENSDDIGGDEMKDVPPEYFYSYKIGNKTYCADIRTAYQNIKSGNYKNPYTNVKLPENIVEDIMDKYFFIQEKVNTDKRTFTQLLADFSSAHPYLNSIELYRKASATEFNTFVRILSEEGVVVFENYDENASLDTLKYKLIEELLKNVINTRYTVRIIYNEVFRMT